MIKEPNIDKAWETVAIEYLKEDVRKMNLQEKIAVYGIIKRHEEIELLLNRPNSSDYKNKTKPTIGSMFNEYQNLCKQLKEKEMSYKSYQRMIKHMEEMGIIRLNLTTLGRSKGISSLIYLGYDIKMLKTIVKDNLIEIDGKLIDGKI
jgi:Cdc6-like AAA superfamily ATPase